MMKWKWKRKFNIQIWIISMQNIFGDLSEYLKRFIKYCFMRRICKSLSMALLIVLKHATEANHNRISLIQWKTALDLMGNNFRSTMKGTRQKPKIRERSQSKWTVSWTLKRGRVKFPNHQREIGGMPQFIQSVSRKCSIASLMKTSWLLN